MERRIRLEILTPFGKTVEADCASVRLPLAQGSAGILPGHAPMLAVLRSGVVRYACDDGMRYAAVSDGTVHVLHDRVSVLCTAADCVPSGEEGLCRVREWAQKAEKEAGEISPAQEDTERG